MRVRGQLDAALSVAEAGVGRFPTAAAAHDLVGRIRADQGDDAAARSAWLAALECDPHCVGALKGLAFLAFRSRDYAEAERRLETAVQQAPHDVTILAALDRVRATHPLINDDQIHFEDPTTAVLLFDEHGLHLAGTIALDSDDDPTELVAAEAIGVVREAERMARLLALGTVEHLLVDGSESRVVVAPVAGGGGVVMRRPLAAPTGRVVALADRAVVAAERWLERRS